MVSFRSGDAPLHGDTGALSLGIVNGLRTGNLFLDMLISTIVCLLIPWAVNRVSKLVTEIALFVVNLTQRRACATRTITLTKVTCPKFCSTVYDSKNNLLQQAILLHMSAINEQWLYKGHKASVVLEALPERDQSNTIGRKEQQLEKQLAGLGKVLYPPSSEKIEVEPGLFFEMTLNPDPQQQHDRAWATGRQEGQDEVSVAHTTITLTCTDQPVSEAHARLDKFLKDAYETYRARASKRDAQGRVMLLLKTCTAVATAGPDKGDNKNGDKGKGGSRQPEPCYERYFLSDNKPMETLFLPQKKQLLALVDDFVHKRGKFGIMGFPHKLGLLLHGPPGTGKTSLIKALAQYTGRNIVAIPLKRIKTNQQLLDLLNKCNFNVAGEDLPLAMPLDKIIFTLEDIDAASHVVRRRRPKEKRDALCSFASDSNSSSNEHNSTKSTIAREVKKRLAPLATLLEDDALDLAGVLNALDGILDSPGRIVVMTTNHPEMLDPALVRPGRVNMRLSLGNLRLPEAEQMIAHYYAEARMPGMTTLQPELAAELRQVFPEGAFSPAFVEELCVENQTFAELIGAIKKERTSEKTGA